MRCFPRSSREVKKVSFPPLRVALSFWYTMHPFAPEGTGAFFERRELEIKENCNVYRERTALAVRPSERRISCKAYTGARRMPWHREAMKDAEDCDKLRGAVNRHRSGGFRMGQPGRRNWRPPADESIVRRSHTRGSETSQYPQEKRSTDIARVVASESAGAQTGTHASRGCGTGTWHCEG